MHLLSLSLCVLRHPVSCFRIIQQDRKHFSFWPAIILYAMLVAVRLIFLQTVHYPLQTTDPRYANWIMECAMLLLPLLSLAVCAFAISSIMDGEMMMRESLTAVAYSMMPCIVFFPAAFAAVSFTGPGRRIVFSDLYGTVAMVLCPLLYQL